MVVSQKYIYFVHIPKTAGTFLTKFVGEQLGGTFVREGHTVPLGTLHPWSERFGPCHYTAVDRDDCFTISVVRNPFDLLVSMYLFGFPYWSPKFYAGTGRINWPFLSFRDYVTKLCAWDDYPWICPEQRGSLFFQLFDAEGRCIADLILRREAIREGLKELGRVLGHDWDPSQERVNATSNYSYVDFYDRDLVDLVLRRYAGDLALFGYEFASWDGRIAIEGSTLNRYQQVPNLTSDELTLPKLSARLADVDFHARSDALLRSYPAKQMVRHLFGRIAGRLAAKDPKNE